jgi:uncharacterized protein YfaS (alpha-2-macroglobulin family)
MLLQSTNQEPFEFTQGDDITLALTATDDQGNPINITGATFATQILGANGSGPVTFPNSQHTIVNAALGQFTLTLGNGGADTTSCGLGHHKQIITALTISGLVTTCRGNNLLTVYPPVPVQ